MKRLIAFLWLGFLGGASGFITTDGSTIDETATDGDVSLGDPITLTWSIVPDGVIMPTFFRAASNTTGESDLIQRFDDLFDVSQANRTANLRNRPWFAFMERSFSSYSRKVGIDYVYVEDDGATFGRPGVLGARGDIRIGGTPLNGVRAYNRFPGDGSNMVIDSDNEAFDTSGPFRLIFVHEHAHGLGLRHQRIVGERGGSLSAVTTRGGNSGGPQFDDILALQRKHGDPLEKNGGNDTPETASSLGTLGMSAGLEVGGDVDGLRVGENESDFVSIDDDGDRDFYEFRLAAEGGFFVQLDPVGPTYELSSEAGDEFTINATRQSDLTLAIFDRNGQLLEEVDGSGLGGSESYAAPNLPSGTYRVRVGGKANAAQLYHLQISVQEGVPGEDADRDGDGQTNVVEEANGRDPDDASDLAFEFNTDGDFEGWDIIQNVADQAVSGGLLTGRTSTFDPRIRQETFGFDADSVPGFLVRQRAAAAGTFEFFWATEAEVNFSGGRRIDADYPSTNNEFEFLYLRLTGRSDWDGQTVTKMRFDPVNVTNTEFEVDFFRASDGDFDDDLIPDEAEIELGLDPTSSADAGLDADGDGRSNLDEFVAGTDPQDAASQLRAVQVANVLPDTFSLAVPVVEGRSYVLEASDSLVAGSWSEVAGATMAEQNRQMVLTAPMVEGRSFFRVVVRLAE